MINQTSGPETVSGVETFDLHEILTVPNAMTASRLLAAPWAYYAAQSPAEDFNWLKIGMVGLTDLEGNVARLGDIEGPVGGLFQTIGCRRSSVGQQGDPIADWLFGLAVASGAQKSGAMPEVITKPSVAQKLFKGAVTVGAKAKGITLEVTPSGKAGEFLQVSGYYGALASEAIENKPLKAATKAASYVLAVTGLGLQTIASVRYANDAGFIRTPRVMRAINRLDDKISRYIPK